MGDHRNYKADIKNKSIEAGSSIDSYRQKLKSKQGVYALSPITLVISACGGGGGDESTVSSGSNNNSNISNGSVLPSTRSFNLTGDILIDSMTQGSKWVFSGDETYNYGIAGSDEGATFREPSKIIASTSAVFDFLTKTVDVNFVYSGHFSNPLSAYSGNTEFVTTLNGSGAGDIFSVANTALAMGGFPIMSPELLKALGQSSDFSGNITLNYDNPDLQAYYGAGNSDGSSFKALMFHEFGHALGLKHPHDDGGAGRPKFGDYGGLSKTLDNDLFTVMSYHTSHGGDFDLNKYDPSTFMVLDVLTLQYLYGKNLSFNSGDTNHVIKNTNSFLSIWDPSGNNTVDLTSATGDWNVALPFHVWSDLSDEPTGWAVSYGSNKSLPKDLAWLIGDFDNITAGSGNDNLYGNLGDNSLFGGAGNDNIEGWEGNDQLSGGPGKDVFYFAAGWGTDTVTDFNSTDDSLILLDKYLDPIDFDTVQIKVENGNTTFSLDANSNLIVMNFDYLSSQQVVKDQELKSSDEVEKETENTETPQSNNSSETESNNSFATADTIEIGTAISGQLSSNTDMDYFKFDTQGNSTLRLAFDAPTNSSYNKYFIASIRDAAGNFMSSQQIGADLTFSTAIENAGTYYIQVEDSTFYNGGQYSLTASLLNGTSGYETETNDTKNTADVLASGSSVTGQIWWKQDLDYYKISTDSASTISINFDAPTNSSYNNYFKVSLQDSSGNVLSAQDTGKDISFDTGVDNAGDYYLVVEDSTFNSTLEYSVTASVNATPQSNNSSETESNNSFATADTIEIGTAISGQLSSNTDMDYFKFDTQGNSTLRLAFDAPTNSSYNKYFIASIRDAAGNFMSSQQIGADLTFSTAIENAGTYYIQVEDSTFYNGGQYSLTASLLNGTSGYETETNDTRNTADVLASGSSVTGQIWWKQDLDYYKISTDSASTISINFDAPTNSSYNNYFKVSLQDSSGNVLSAQDTGKDISFDTGVDNAGDYYLVVEDSTFNSTLEYSVTASVNATPQSNNSSETESNNSFATADTIEIGTAISGQLSSNTDMDYFKFDTQGNSTLRLAFDAPTNSSYNKYFIASIRDAAGNFMSSQQIGADLTFSTAIENAGTYYIQVEDSTFYNGGQYSLTASLLNGTSGYETETNDTRNTADVLASGSSVTGQIWWKQDLDYYKISTDSASTISINFDAPTNSSYNNYFKVSLQDSSGNVLSAQDTGKDISFDTGVDNAGDYYLVVEDSTFNSTLEYSVTASVNATPQSNNSSETESNNSFATADTIEIGTAISGQLSSNTDMDYFKFDTQGNSTLRLAFDAPTNSSYNKYFIASIRDAAGNFMSSQQIGADLTFSTAIENAGTYYIQVEDSTFYNGGQYSLTASLLNGTSGYETETNDTKNTADVLASGSSVTGQIWWKQDLDYYKISTDSASTISINFDAPTNSSYNNYFKVSLQDSSGNVLSAQDTGKDISFDTGVDNAGDYYLVVEDSTFNSTLEYSVTASVNATPQSNNSSETESNNSFATADTIEIGTAISGQLSSNTDMDYFKFDTQGNSTLRLAFDAPTNSSYNKYFIASIRDAAGNFMSSQQIGADLTFSTAIENAGTYYIQVEDSTFYNGGQYSLTASLLNGTSGYETETNDTKNTADVLASGSSVTGQIWWKQDLDYYKISTDSASTISINFDAPTNSSYNNYFKVSLQDSSGNVLSAQDTGKDISFDTGVDNAGDYYLVVEDSTFNSTLEYSVTASVIM